MTQTNIVQLNVSQTIAPAPDTLQQTGAIISVGGTSTAANTSTLLTQAADLTPILAAAVVITTITWSGSVATVTTTSTHGYTTGDLITIAGMTPTGYNGTFAITVTSSTTFTYALVSNPGSQTVAGVATDADVAELVAQVTTFFAQGSNVSVYVLELGHGTAVTGVAALAAYITAHPGAYYAYWVPRLWDAESTFVTLVNLYTSNTAKLYFFVTATLSTYASFLGKSVYMMIEAPTIPATEFTLAGDFYWVLSQKPSSTNKVPPVCFGYRIGVTAYPITNAQKTTFKVANLNYITTGAEGGISNKMVVWGHTADGRPLNYWYSVDWVQINLNLNLSNEIINGSNTSLAPLYYDQNGINRLQNRSLSVMNQAVQNGLALGKVISTKYTQAEFISRLNNGEFAGNIVINAVPFGPYSAANPTHFALGEYDGLSAVYTPSRGFETIIFNLNVTDFVGA